MEGKKKQCGQPLYRIGRGRQLDPGLQPYAAIYGTQMPKRADRRNKDKRTEQERWLQAFLSLVPLPHPSSPLPLYPASTGDFGVQFSFFPHPHLSLSLSLFSIWFWKTLLRYFAPAVCLLQLSQRFYWISFSCISL